MGTVKENRNERYGVIAQYADAGAVLHAAELAREKGYTVMDAYTPVPIHGLDEALGRTRSPLAWFVFAGGVAGFFGGLGLQVWVSAIEYPLIVGGRPLLSWASFIPVTFETTILGAALTAVIGMFALNGLPKPYNPVFYAKNFERASLDRYFLCIESTDPRFNEEEVTALLRSTHPEEVSTVINPDHAMMG